jgi:hypothetical protein
MAMLQNRRRYQMAFDAKCRNMVLELETKVDNGFVTYVINVANIAVAHRET